MELCVGKVRCAGAVLRVLCDLSAAFDAVDHNTLFQLLSCRFEVDGFALVWYTSYLTDRTQIFQLGAQQSGPFVVDCSVPQGSVLRPQGLIAYTDDLACLIDRHELGHHLYADDAQLIDSARLVEIYVAIDIMQQCVE
jgi:Reverse transcriptase (RNA-dependent DNA polymerase)